ncbi:MAG TPA: hypothetical protein VGL62_11245 [Vicinamibacterales bacterium]|jgi:hypothetical protein
MLRDVIILGSCASAFYAWLCAIVSPIARAIDAVAVRRATAARAALALAIGGGLLWTLIGLAGLFVSMMLEPRAGLALLTSPLGLVGLGAGLAAWAVYAGTTRHVPRIGSTFEVATALAIVALVRDDPDTLARIEALYRANAAPESPSHGRGTPRKLSVAGTW